MAPGGDVAGPAQTGPAVTGPAETGPAVTTPAGRPGGDRTGSHRTGKVALAIPTRWASRVCRPGGQSSEPLSGELVMSDGGIHPYFAVHLRRRAVGLGRDAFFTGVHAIPQARGVRLSPAWIQQRLTPGEGVDSCAPARSARRTVREPRGTAAAERVVGRRRRRCPIGSPAQAVRAIEVQSVRLWRRSDPSLLPRDGRRSAARCEAEGASDDRGCAGTRRVLYRCWVRGDLLWRIWLRGRDRGFKGSNLGPIEFVPFLPDGTFYETADEPVASAGG